jgi:amidohydrolase
MTSPPPLPDVFAAQAPQLAGWRRHLHAHPELAYQEHATAAFVAERLREFGFDEVHTGIGRTGVVGVLHGAAGPASGREQRIAVRADMDALPILEATGAAYASQAPGTMHACGHDGHTTMLLGAARHLAATRRFAGTAVFVFQPAEEDGAGAEAMLRDGLFDRFPVRAAYGMHNKPGMPIGHFATRRGPFLGATTEFYLRIRGRGAHAAEPQAGQDPIVALAQVIVALQTIVSRNVPSLESAVLTVTRVEGGKAINVIPEEAGCEGTIRVFSSAVQETMKARLRAVAEGVAGGLGCTAELRIEDGYPVLVNDAAETAFALSVAADVAGADAADGTHPLWPGAEDFAYFAREVPSAFVLIGNGPSAALHHPAFDFCDATAPYGVAYWVRLVERALPA